MQVIGYILLACIVLAVVKAVVVALAVMTALYLLWSAMIRPRETAGLVLMLIVASLIQSHGVAFLFVVALGTAVTAARS